MKGWKGITLAALALCALLAAGVFWLKASAAGGTVYLMAVNEKVLDTTPENMPAVMGGTLYVPYTMLSIRVNRSGPYPPLIHEVAERDGENIALAVQGCAALDGGDLR